MPEIHKSTVRSRALGDEIRLAMERAPISGKRLAELLGWSESKVSRTLTGTAPPNDVDLAAILALCGVTGDRRDFLLELSRTDNYQNWHTSRNSMLGQLRKASKIIEFRESVIPSILQVPSYTRAVLGRTTELALDDIESWVTKIEHVQVVFNDVPPPHCTFFLHEQALRLPVGQDGVMREQYSQLLRASTYRYIELRIVPTEVGVHPGLGNPFCLLEFKDDVMPAIYDEDEAAGHFREDPMRVTAIRRVIAGLAAVALDRAGSRKLIEDVATHQDGTSEDLDGDDQQDHKE